MATKVKPSRINITGTPQAGQVPMYVDEDTFQWGSSGSSGYGRFLSLWDCTTGQPISFPEATPYNYMTGDYFIVSVVSSATPPVNYRPNGSSYTGTASSTSETEDVKIGDTYVYDGSVWLLQFNNGTTYTASTGISINSSNQISNTGVLSVNGNTGVVTVETPNMKAFYLSSTSDLTNAQAAYDWYLAGKNPIIVYSNTAFSLDTASASSLIFIGGYSETMMSSSRTVIYERHLDLNISGGTVTSISGLSDTTKDDVSVLDTQTNYSTPYTPQYDGSPATKKYVDDGLSAKVTGPASSTDGHLALFDGATGKLIKDGGAVPTGVPAVGTNGQVLTVVSGAAAWANATGGSTTLSVTLTTAGWSGGTQTVIATGVTSSNTVIISPAPASIQAYVNAGVYCSAQGTNSLTFTASQGTPSSNLTVNVVILS